MNRSGAACANAPITKSAARKLLRRGKKFRED
jgi:hypothetical protein